MAYPQLQPTPPQLTLAERVQAQLNNIYAAHGQTPPSYPVGGYATQQEQPGIADSALSVAQKYALRKLLKGGFGGSNSALATTEAANAAYGGNAALAATEAANAAYGGNAAIAAGEAANAAYGGNALAAGGQSLASGGSSQVATATPIGAYVAPVMMAALMAKTLHDKSQKHARTWNLKEVLGANKFGQQIAGYDKLTDPQRAAFVQALYGKQGGKGIMLQGYANGSGQTTKMGNAVLRDSAATQAFLHQDATNPTIQYEQTQKLYDDLLARRAAGGRIQQIGVTETSSGRGFDVDAQLAKMKQSLADQQAIMAQVAGGKDAKKK